MQEKLIGQGVSMRERIECYRQGTTPELERSIASSRQRAEGTSSERPILTPEKLREALQQL